MYIDAPLFILFVLPGLVAMVYLMLFAILRIAGVRDRSKPSLKPQTRFLILIPAHNEQSTVTGILASCQNLNYPVDRWEVCLVADNCSDDTAQIARDYGVTVLERNDASKTGKGHAVSWAIRQLENRPFDALVIVDADCKLSRESLRIVDSQIRQGASAVQLNHRVTNPDANAISYAAAVGRVLEYDLFFAPKSQLGLNAMLVGTGMVLTKDLLQQVPWDSTSCAEDTEYTLRLTRENVPIRFASQAHVEVQSAASREQMQVQASALGKRQSFLGTHRSDSVVPRRSFAFGCSQVGSGIDSGNLEQAAPFDVRRFRLVVLPTYGASSSNLRFSNLGTDEFHGRRRTAGVWSHRSPLAGS